MYASRYDHNREEYQCVPDDTMDPQGSGTVNQDGRLFYQAELRGFAPSSGIVDGETLGCRKCVSSRGNTPFVIWGKSQCPNGDSEWDSKLMYAGEMGGSKRNHAGGGSNFLCVARDARNGTFAARDSGMSFVTPVKYDTVSFGANTLTHLDGDAVPCAVCEADQSVNTLVIHGTTKCPSFYNKARL